MTFLTRGPILARELIYSPKQSDVRFKVNLAVDRSSHLDFGGVLLGVPAHICVGQTRCRDAILSFAVIM